MFSLMRNILTTSTILHDAQGCDRLAKYHMKPMMLSLLDDTNKDLWHDANLVQISCFNVAADGNGRLEK